MSDFNWRTKTGADDWTSAAFANRFIDEAASGGDVWREWLGQRGWLDAQSQSGALADLRSRLSGATRAPVRPRVFVSHRQNDAAEALRIAYLANRQCFEFWLDILDPQLRGTTAQTPAVIIASIIEMALLNCSHVIAVLSPQTRGSLWVPYEYGRVKEQQTKSSKAAAWLHPQIRTQDIPDYTVLGRTTQSEADVNAWFVAELPVPAPPANKWNGAIPAPLP